MRYRNGQEVQIGDLVTMSGNHRGTVVACIEEGAYVPPHSPEQWIYLRQGILVDTSFGGLIHFPDEAAMGRENMQLSSRAA